MGRHSFIAALVVCSAAAASAQMQVVSTSPTLNANAGENSVVSVTFDRALDTATVNASNFRVFGRVSGTKGGMLSFPNSATVTLTPNEPFAAGETVLVNLGNSITGDDDTPLRSAGYAFSFGITTQAAGLQFTEIAEMSNRDGPGTTRIYGAMSSDLNNDQYADLTTVNEDSGDLRVFMNKATGTGEYHPFLEPPLPVGFESSPNEPADFNNDGKTDICVSSADDNLVAIALGNGNGTFATADLVPNGTESHGIAVLDVDGDADLDIVHANRASGNLGMMLNDGTGDFGDMGTVSTFDGGVIGEYGLAAGDTNGDGITDLIVAGRDGQEVRALLGNGNGTFTPAAAQDSGGSTWVVVTGDVNGDGDLDLATANSFSGNVGILLGNGDGTFDPPSLIAVGPHIPSVDLGDLDGDGDTDVALSSYGGGFWQVYTNNGSGSFSFNQQINATANPSCSILVDIDNDDDLDMVLTDEIADTVKLMRNGPISPLPCPASPPTCREPDVSGKASLKVKNSTAVNSNQILWKWLKGAATTKMEYGDPDGGTDHYTLCIYDNGTLVSTSTAEAGGTCGSSPCWSDETWGYKFKDAERDEFGVQKVLLKEGTSEKAKIIFKGKGPLLDVPDLDGSGGPIDVRLIKSTGMVCWGATYSAPFIQNDGGTFKDKAD
jgi:hypothetical protein